MSPGEVLFEVELGARFVVFDYVVSVLIVAYLRRSPAYFLRPGQSALPRGLPYALLSFFLGWWNFPWGLIRTHQRIYETLLGGRDITQRVVESIKVNPETALRK